MNKKALVGVVAVVLACLVALGGTAFWLIKKRRGGGTGTARFAPTSFVVVTGDLAQIRGFAPARSLRDMVLRPAADAPGGVRDVSREYQSVVRDCGMDPWETVDRFSVGADRAVLQARNPSEWLGYIDGRFTPAQGQHCLEALARRDHHRLVAQQVNGFTVHFLARENDPPTERTGGVHFMDHTAVIADRRYMPTAVQLAHGSLPGMPSDAPIARMLRTLGGNNALNVAADLAAIKAQNTRTIDEAVDDLVRANPNNPDITLARQAQTGGVAMAFAGGGVNVTARAEFPQATVARPFAAAMTTFVTARRGDVEQLVDEVRRNLGAMRLVAVLGNAQLRERFDEIEAGLTVLRGLPSQITVRHEDRSVVVLLPVPPPQVTTLERSIRAGAAVVEEMSRTPMFPGLGGGGRRGGGIDLQLPGMQGGPEREREIPVETPPQRRSDEPPLPGRAAPAPQPAP